MEQLILGKYDVVDASTLYKNWRKIDRESFAGQYTPDILVVEEWNLFEKKKKPLVIVEVNRPTVLRGHRLLQEVLPFWNGYVQTWNHQ